MASKLTTVYRVRLPLKLLYDAIRPLYETFFQKKNQDKLVESLFGLIPKSCELLNCKDYKAANLIHLPDHLLGFHHIICGRTGPLERGKVASQSPQTNIDKLDPADLCHMLPATWSQNCFKRLNARLGNETTSYRCCYKTWGHYTSRQINFYLHKRWTCLTPLTTSWAFWNKRNIYSENKWVNPS